MTVAWGTDVHLNFVPPGRIEAFCASVLESRAEALLLGGDIAEAPELEDTLRLLETRLRLPIWFVLGNHDYYVSSIAAIEGRMRGLESPWLHWLPGDGVGSLTRRTALVGHGGWADARHGNFLASPVTFSDWVMIEDLRTATGSEDPLAVFADRPALQRKLRALGDRAAAELRPSLLEAAAASPAVVVLTHVPPFRETAWYRGAPCDDDWLPGTTCRALGDLLLEVASATPAVDFTVLSGHTHGDAEARLLPNLRAITQGARYGEPGFRLLEIA